MKILDSLIPRVLRICLWSGSNGSASRNFEDNFQANLDLDPYESIEVATILGEDGYYHQEDLINYWGTVVFNPDIEDEKFERWMDVLDLMPLKKDL